MTDAATPPPVDQKPATPPPAEPPAAEPPPLDLATMQRELADARKEAAKYRTERNDLQKAADAAADAEKTELQKAIDRADRAESENETLHKSTRDRDLALAAQTEAIRLGFRRPERALREIDPDKVTYGSDGTAENIAKLLEDELKARPELKAAAPVAPDAGGGNRGQATLTVDQIRAKSPEWIADHIEEVDEAMAVAGR